MAEAQSSILIVDDDAEDLASVERTLRALGTALVSIKDPHEVMPGVHRHRPDVVIVDALLPGLSGFDLCKQIKSNPQLKGTQVLILTGVYLRQQYRQEALQQFKADAFLTKPFRPPELQRLVVQLLARKMRMPQSSFLKRIGLPASGEPKKRGLFGRIFGRSEASEHEITRIAPTPRDTPEAPPAEPAHEAQARVEAVVTELSLEPPREKVTPKQAEPPQPPEPIAIEAEEAKPEREAPAAVAPAPAPAQEPDPTPAPDAASSAPEPQPEPVEILESVPPSLSEPIPATGVPAPAAQPPEIVDAEASVETDPSSPAGIAADLEPSASAMLDAPPPSDPEEVNWVEVDSRTLDGKFEEVCAPVSETAPAFLEDLAAGPRVESFPAADSPRTMRRPLFRVGEVPIYDEAGFLTELKRELSKCKRVDRPLTLILIRVGDLGQIIELFGRDFREPVLWHIAEQAMETLREVDLVGMMSSKNLIAMTAFASDRYGGGRIVSRMRQAVARKPFRIGEELPPIVPALDFGMATFPADGSEISNLLRRAEEDLTEGKDRAAVSD